MTPHKIKNIIFDLGGVLLNIDYNAPVKAFRELGIQKFNDMYSQANQSGVFDDFETGKISPEEFRAKIKKLAEEPITDEQLDAAWNSILLDLPANRLDFLKRIKTGYNIYLLSNTNEIHIHSFERSIFKQYPGVFFHELFDKCYYSSRVGLRKPDRAIFEMVLRENGLNAHETIFIDDSPQHIDGAIYAGLNVLHIEKGQEVEEMLNDYGILSPL